MNAHTNRRTVISFAILLVVGTTSPCYCDFIGPEVAVRAMSPDGQLVVRITKGTKDPSGTERAKHGVSFYEFDSAANAYVFRSSFTTDSLSQLLYVSNSGELAMISLKEEESLRLHKRDGTLLKSWNLRNFLSAAEITACAKTGSTIQWLEEASFVGKRFYIRGPSRVIRALKPPYTVMRGVAEDVEFFASIDVDTAKLTKRAAEDD